jgi:hypothetical protein
MEALLPQRKGGRCRPLLGLLGKRVESFPAHIRAFVVVRRIAESVHDERVRQERVDVRGALSTHGGGRSILSCLQDIPKPVLQPL